MNNGKKFVAQQAYGKLERGFQIELGDKGYFSIAGLNNAGKTTVLQWLFAQSQNTIYIPAERGIVRPTIDSGTLQLGQYIGTFKDRIANAPLDSVQFGHGSVGYGSSIPIREIDSYSECLISSMIRDKGITKSITELGQYIKLFLLGEEVDDKNDQFLIDNRPITQMGTGARSLLMVIMALIHPDYTTVLIDEPELFLEPRLQKALRDLFMQKGVEKRIVAATHSHLFLNRAEDQYDHNFYFEDTIDTARKLKATTTKTDLRDLTFRLLGASFDDLMLPENYLIVEGDSDRIFMEKVIRLVNLGKAAKVQVAYSQGIQNTPSSINVIAEMVRPYYAEDSVYKERVVCMIDEPTNNAEERTATSLSDVLNKAGDKRFFTLGQTSNGDKLNLENTIPGEIYDRTTYKKLAVLAEIQRLKDYQKLGKYKVDVATALAEVLKSDDLVKEEMTIFRLVAEQVCKPIQ